MPAKVDADDRRRRLTVAAALLIADEGIGARSVPARSRPERGRGMGLLLLRELCTVARVEPGSSGTVVTMGFARPGR